MCECWWLHEINCINTIQSKYSMCTHTGGGGSAENRRRFKVPYSARFLISVLFNPRVLIQRSRLVTPAPRNRGLALCLQRPAKANTISLSGWSQLLAEGRESVSEPFVTSPKACFALLRFTFRDSSFPDSVVQVDRSMMFRVTIAVSVQTSGISATFFLHLVGNKWNCSRKTAEELNDEWLQLQQLPVSLR